MSDLDDFFARKLEEEASFSNRTKNWKQMSQRLDAFDSGAVQGSPTRLRVWQAAAIITLVASGLLLWKLFATQQENKALQDAVTNLETERSALKQQWLQRPIQEAPAVQSEKQSFLATDNVQPIYKSQNRLQPNEFVQKASQPHSKYADDKEVNSFIKIREKEINQGHFESSSVGTTLPNSVFPTNPSVQNSDVPKEVDPIVTKVPSVIDLAQTQDSIRAISTPKDSVLNILEQAQDSIAASAPIAQQIKPATTQNKRFKIGTQATLGFVQPKQKGISAIRGQGIVFEAKVLPSVWITGSIDWLHHEVCTKGFVAKFHPKHDSFPPPPDNGGGGWQPKPKLVLVESTPRQQSLGLGIRYTMPVEFWVRPSLALSHHWVHTSPTLVIYKFEEEDPGGPGPNPHSHETRYTAESFDSQWINNQWRLGVGIEKELKNWTFGLSADYSKDFSASTPGFDAMYLRAGAQYRF